MSWALAAGGYLVGFLCLWSPLMHASPWWAACFLPLGFGLALAGRRPVLVTIPVFLLFVLAGLVAWEGDVLLALVGMVLALWAWDFALLETRMARAGEIPHRWHLVRGQAIRSGAIALGGLAVALLFHLAHFLLAFWEMLGLMAAAWIAVLLLLRQARRLYSSRES
ncbi:MAG: hypothetical protein DDT24_00477 [Chloroflexi bacterium]|nr:hypothetical protein [Chloroflexota bacterium]MBT9166103.1 hypothetical protein [Chloroflexota bacterium]